MFTHLFPKLKISVFLVCSFFSPLLGGAVAQIDWGTSAVFEKVITSDGRAVTLAEFSVELGAFGNGFVPTSDNTDEWVGNWMVFDAVTDPDTDTNGPGGISADGFASLGLQARFVGTGYLDMDQTSLSEDANGTDVFGAGLQAYVFIRNSDATDPGSEWLLYTSTTGDVWEYPNTSGGQTQFPEEWFLSDVDTVVWGGINGMEGPGEFTDPSTDFALKTHTFIPEPGVFVLSLVAFGFALSRRERCSSHSFPAC